MSCRPDNGPRDGSHVGTKEKSQLNREQLIAMMVGRSMEVNFPSKKRSWISQASSS